MSFHPGYDMIRFSCPHCGTAVSAPEDRAGAVALCGACRRQIQVPPLQPAPRQAEVVFFKDRDVIVTSARLVVGASTYALRDFTSVRRAEYRQRSTQPFGNRRLAAVAAGGVLLACVSLGVAGLMPSGGPWGVLDGKRIPRGCGAIGTTSLPDQRPQMLSVRCLDA